MDDPTETTTATDMPNPFDGNELESFAASLQDEAAEPQAEEAPPEAPEDPELEQPVEDEPESAEQPEDEEEEPDEEEAEEEGDADQEEKSESQKRRERRQRRHERELQEATQRADKAESTVVELRGQLVEHSRQMESLSQQALWMAEELDKRDAMLAELGHTVDYAPTEVHQLRQQVASLEARLGQPDPIQAAQQEQRQQYEMSARHRQTMTEIADAAEDSGLEVAVVEEAFMDALAVAVSRKQRGLSFEVPKVSDIAQKLAGGHRAQRSDALKGHLEKSKKAPRPRTTTRTATRVPIFNSEDEMLDDLEQFGRTLHVGG